MKQISSLLGAVSDGHFLLYYFCRRTEALAARGTAFSLVCPVLRKRDGHPFEAMRTLSFRGKSTGAAGFLLAVALFLAAVWGGPAAAAVPADWVKLVVQGKFELMAPPGSKYVPRQGIDSAVGRVETPDFTLDFDYGAYSDPLKPRSGFLQYRSREVTVDGKAARIVTAFSPEHSADRPYFIGIHFDNLKRSVIGPVRLTMATWVGTPKAYKTIESVFGTITFK